MGTTFARNAPVDLGRAIHVEPVALKYPDLTMVIAHMGHPWYGDCIAVSRKQPNVYCEVSALFYRPWQYYNILIEAQEYKIIDKIFFGTDFPFSRVGESVDGLLNDQRPACRHGAAARQRRNQVANSRIRSVQDLVEGRLAIVARQAAAGGDTCAGRHRLDGARSDALRFRGCVRKTELSRAGELLLG